MNFCPVRLTKTLSGHRAKLLWAALVWTAIVTVLCLVRFQDLPSLGVMHHDKLGHAAFHFVLTALWFLYFRYGRQVPTGNGLIRAFAFSVLYGIAIELCQYYFTDTRKADALDVLANVSGSLGSIVLLWATKALFRKR